MEPEIGCTYESTVTDHKEAVKVVWVTGHDEPEDRLILVGHGDGCAATLTREQWDVWCSRVGAQMWEEDRKRLEPPPPSGLNEDQLRTLAYVAHCCCQYSMPIYNDMVLIIETDGQFIASLIEGGYLEQVGEGVRATDKGVGTLNHEHWPVCAKRQQDGWGGSVE